MNNPWAVLGLQPGASAEEIQRAYRAAQLRWHPDRAAEADKAAFEARFREVECAYEQLSRENGSVFALLRSCLDGAERLGSTLHAVRTRGGATPDEMRAAQDAGTAVVGAAVGLLERAFKSFERWRDGG